jgi:hypothetical protein
MLDVAPNVNFTIRLCFVMNVCSHSFFHISVLFEIWIPLDIDNRTDMDNDMNMAEFRDAMVDVRMGEEGAVKDDEWGG